MVSRRKLYITKFSYSFVCEIDRCSEHDFMYLFMVYLIWRDAVYIEVQRRGNPYILFILFHFSTMAEANIELMCRDYNVPFTKICIVL